MNNDNTGPATLELISEYLQDPLFYTDRLQNVLWLNRRAEELFNVKRMNVLNKPLQAVTGIKIIPRLLGQVIAGETPVDGSDEEMTVRVKKHNRSYFFNIVISPKKILLVEDEKNIILAVRTCLDAVGYEVAVVEDGEAALRFVRKEKPSLILLDLLLPGTDGFKVLAALKKKSSTSDIPVIVLTARTGEVDRQRALALKADDYVTKPFRPRELWDLLKKYLPEETDQ